MLTLKKFRAAVKKAIKADYAQDATDAQIEEAMEANEDVLEGCYEDAQDSDDIEAAIDEAANNIAMCDL